MKHQFKPFDQVLVRDSDEELWTCDMYSHKSKNGYVCSNRYCWNQCIPYNEETAHLVGTSEPYQEPEPKVWQVSSHGDSPQYLTAKEVSNFIKIAVLNNKDITDVHIKYIGQ